VRLAQKQINDTSKKMLHVDRSPFSKTSLILPFKLEKLSFHLPHWVCNRV
jgi:hypothetical protein